MNIEKIKEIIELSKLLDNSKSSNQSKSSNNGIWQVGKNYLIRTVTMHLVGKLKKVGDKELVLSSASWIADTGRFHNALKGGVSSLENSEIEPFINDVIVGRGAVIDATIYDHKINLKQK